MFEVGKTYVIEEFEGHDVIGRHNCKVLEYDEQKGLLKIDQLGKIKIINVSSPNFVGAEPTD